MNRLKFWLEQTMTISFAIFVGIILEGVVYQIFKGESLASFSLSWLQLLSVVLTGAVCSVPTVIWLSDNDIPKNKFVVQMILHCICHRCGIRPDLWLVQSVERIHNVDRYLFHGLCLCMARVALVPQK